MPVRIYTSPLLTCFVLYEKTFSDLGVISNYHGKISACLEDSEVKKNIVKFYITDL